jgi:Flp pilus assembly pilin Flp
MVSTFSKHIQNKNGASAIKYSLIAALMALAVIVGTNVIAFCNPVIGDL